MSTRAALLLAFPWCPLLACGPSSPAPVEIEDPVTPEMVAWLRDHVIPFETVVQRDDRSDLTPLLEIVGDARVVALGEATHGTLEFFRMKHRILDLLVQEKGFNLFAIEASWPEVNRINGYVLRGEGDAGAALAGQYFWTWRTRSVLDMIHWMRSHNQNPGDASLVSFLGFDMQYPGMAIHNVLRYLEAVDPDTVSYVDERLSCIDANDYRGYFATAYRDRGEAYQNRCREDVDEVYALFQESRETFEAVSSPYDFAQASRSIRIVQQWEDLQASRIPYARDRYMAENALWLLEQGGPDAKIVLWAHNGHVQTRNGRMGDFLRAELGDDLVVVGFDFYRGHFTAVRRIGETNQGLATHSVDAPPWGTYEHYFRAADIPRFLLDLRGVDYSTPATQWLAGPRPMRSVGAVYDSDHPGQYFVSDTRMPLEYDVMIYFEDTYATQVLTLEFPTGF